MDLTFESAVSFATLIASLAGSWAVVKNRLSSIEDDRRKDQEDRRRFQAYVEQEMIRLREWRYDHEKDSASVRLDIQKQFGEIRETQADIGGAFKQIMAAIEDIRKRLDALKA